MSRCLPILLLLLAVSCPSASPKDLAARNRQELDDAVRRARPGDSIVLADGVWRDAELLLEADGTRQEPITLRGQTPGQVELVGHSRVRLAGRHLVVSGLLFRQAWHESALVEFRKDSKKAAEDCRLTDCALVDCHPPEPDRGFKYVSVYGRRNRVDHCRLEGKRNEGATLVVWLQRDAAEHRIDHVLFGPRPRLGTNGGESIRVGDSATSMVAARVVVEDNCFEACDGEVEIISNKSCENIYRRNTFLRCEGALTLRHGNRCLVEGNYFLGQGKRLTGGVRIIGQGHRVINNYFCDLAGDEARAAVSMMNGIPDSPLEGYFQVDGALVAFNTFVHCKCNVAIGLGDKKDNAVLPPKNCTVANNAFVLAKGQLVDEESPAEGFVWQGNLVEAPGPVAERFARKVSDLQFRQDDGGIWRPSAGSPVVGGAVGNFPEVRENIDGHSRPAAAGVGCDQAGRGGPPQGALKPGEVGTSWGVPPEDRFGR